MNLQGRTFLPSVKYCNAHQHGFYFGDEDKQPTPPVEKPVALSPKELELLELFNALPESEQDTQLAEMRARVKNFNKLFEELLKARQRTNKR